MSEARQVPWVRVAVEGMAIVASILLAFGIQAWWDQRSQGLEVARELGSVAQEIAENRQQLVYQVDLTRRMVAGGDAMLQILEQRVQDAVVQLPDTLVFLSASSGTTLDASLGALNALVASGRLAFIDDLEVRGRLAGLAGRFDDIVANQVRGVALSDTQIRPALYEDFDNRAANQVARTFYGGRNLPGQPLTHAVSVDFPNSMVTRGLIGFRNTLLAGTLPKMELLLSDLDELLDLLA